MEGPLKELAKLDKLTAQSYSRATVDSLDCLLESLQNAKQLILEEGMASEDPFLRLVQAVETHKKEVDERQKEIYGSLSRFGKVVDKVSFSFGKME
jgi:hypothetical protein